ncbi:cupin [Frondihabitans sucicola]|uniref:Cupin n=2 Tax=Frondihabitans sucicola TaxID=1268041 RepID=A0ABN6Y3S9_9MICO|nr:cupin domain-containing protein [Frondihabitans sucicola]BDZ51729.1 cupin [Frondihabitans sucicola]
MKLQPMKPTAKNPATQFTGDVWVDMIGVPQDDGQRASTARVHFSPGARSNWHSHGLGQTIHVTEGIAWIQARGGEILEVHPGQTVYTAPGEEHWHGASPDAFMEHLVMMDIPDDPSTATTWLEPVTDDEYRRP